MKLALFVLACLLSSSAFAYLDWAHVGNGQFVKPSEVPTWTIQQAKALKAQGLGHVSCLAQATPKNDGSAIWPSLFPDPLLRDIERFVYINRIAGLRTIVKTTGWAQEHTRVLTSYVKGESVAYFTAWPAQVAKEIRRWDAQNWCGIELMSESNWWANTLNPILRAQAVPDEPFVPLSHDAARTQCLDYFNRYLDTVLPTVYAECPQVSVIVGGVAYAGPLAVTEWKGWNLSRWAGKRIRVALHMYEPWFMTHAGVGGSYIPPFVWPDPAGAWKLLVSDPLSAAYAMNYQPATRDGLKAQIKAKADWFLAQGIPMYAGETGCHSNAPFVAPYMADLTGVLDELTIPRCVFRW